MKRPLLCRRAWAFLPLICCYLLPIFSNPASAQFDPEKLSQSTVRVVVKSKGKVVSVASGFVWLSPDQVVTSLHVMDTDPSAVFIVEFGRKRRKATVKKVLPEADLVLLQVQRANLEWTPLTVFEPEKPQYQSRVTALGFNKGALGMSTRELVKGFAKPEVLAKLLPGRAARILKRTNMPSVDLPIYYLDGSLLPGYSGSPVVNSVGQLIGIGNGGLESGASSVSWVIPANNLHALLSSELAEIPGAFARSKQLFSSDQLAPQTNTSRLLQQLFQKPQQRYINKGLFAYPWRLNPLSLMQQLTPLAHASTSAAFDAELQWHLPGFNFREVEYQQFRFVRVKTRSFAQMLASSGRPGNIEHTLALFRHFFSGFKIGYQDMQFDVYTDAHYGLNLIVPNGIELNNDGGFLVAEGALFCQLCPFEIQYHARTLSTETQKKITSNPQHYLADIASQHWMELNHEGDYQEYRRFRGIEDYGSGRHVLRAAYSDFEEPFKDYHELNYFIAANNRDAWFQVQGIISAFDEYFFEDLQRYAGTDCTTGSLSGEQKAVCQQVESAFKVLASSHFTSFSNRLF